MREINRLNTLRYAYRCVLQLSESFIDHCLMKNTHLFHPLVTVCHCRAICWSCQHQCELRYHWTLQQLTPIISQALCIVAAIAVTVRRVWAYLLISFLPRVSSAAERKLYLCIWTSVHLKRRLTWPVITKMFDLADVSGLVIKMAVDSSADCLNDSFSVYRSILFH
jgi:hypothetical protein